MIATVQTGSLHGVEAHGVWVEVSQTRGLPGFDIVGLPEAAVRESRVRVLAALANCGFKLPDRRFIVNLAPADVRKAGASFDLAIALSLLRACGLCADTTLERTLVLGELSLDGRLRSVRGVLAQLRSARQRGCDSAIVPAQDACWAGLVCGMRVYLANDLAEAVALCDGTSSLPTARASDAEGPAQAPATPDEFELGDVVGQSTAKRALEICAAGNHTLLMVGAPGTGKTMLARRLPALLPPPNDEEQLEIATIASVSGTAWSAGLGTVRPFRAPHHSCSDAALIGGGDPIRPGEVTLAHGGVLFLDELPEFRRSAIEALRPTMESGIATIVRTKQRVTMPAKPLIVAAMNPCPCGYAGDRKRICRCSPGQAEHYRTRVSGPILDRFDLHVRLPPVSASELGAAGVGMVRDVSAQRASEGSSASVRERVASARAMQVARGVDACLRGAQHVLHATGMQLDAGAKRLLLHSIDTLGLSLRAYGKVLRVARTIADLAGSDAIRSGHVAEAVQYRLLDREHDGPHDFEQARSQTGEKR